MLGSGLQAVTLTFADGSSEVGAMDGLGRVYLLVEVNWSHSSGWVSDEAVLLRKIDQQRAGRAGATWIEKARRFFDGIAKDEGGAK